MILNLFYTFIIEVKTPTGTKELNAYLRDLTSKEKKELNKLGKRIEEMQHNSTQYERLSRSLDIKRDMAELLTGDDKLSMLKEIEKITDEADKLKDKTFKEYNDFDMDAPVRYRLETCLGGDDAKEILKMAEDIGYVRVMDIVTKAIAESAEKKS